MDLNIALGAFEDYIGDNYGENAMQYIADTVPNFEAYHSHDWRGTYLSRNVKNKGLPGDDFDYDKDNFEEYGAWSDALIGGSLDALNEFVGEKDFEIVVDGRSGGHWLLKPTGDSKKEYEKLVNVDFTDAGRDFFGKLSNDEDYGDAWDEAVDSVGGFDYTDWDTYFQITGTSEIFNEIKTEWDNLIADNENAKFHNEPIVENKKKAFEAVLKESDQSWLEDRSPSRNRGGYSGTSEREKIEKSLASYVENHNIPCTISVEMPDETEQEWSHLVIVRIENSDFDETFKDYITYDTSTNNRIYWGFGASTKALISDVKKYLNKFRSDAGKKRITSKNINQAIEEILKQHDLLDKVEFRIGKSAWGSWECRIWISDNKAVRIRSGYIQDLQTEVENTLDEPDWQSQQF